MKDLKTHLLETVKPPRLSAKNKHLWMHPTEEEVMKWLERNCRVEGKVEIVDGKINVKGDVLVFNFVKEFPYPFGEVTGYFNCAGCKRLTSLKNAPQKVGGSFWCYDCGKNFTEEDVRKVCVVKGYIYL